MAPDVGAPTLRADVYSVGVILYELLCGQTPMGSYLSPSQIREDLPSKLDDVIDLALASNPEDRYPTARDMRNDIQRLFQEDEPGSATPVRSRRNLYLAITGGVILLATVASFFFIEDPVTAAKNADAKLRASVVKGNVLPNEATVQEKVALRPDMVWIPEGSFIKGRMNSERATGPSEPQAEVKKVKAFYIDRFEWPNGQGKNADVRVTWDNAGSQCASVGKRLCTSDEWERACKGPESLIFPYGDEFDPTKCGDDVAKDSDKDGKTDHRSGSLAECKSGFGVFDLSGGPREWTSSGRGAVKTIKGGRRGLKPEVATRCAWSDEQKPAIDDATLSFRCCSDDVPPGEVTPPAEGAAPAAPSEAAPKPG
jgi:formylglycine-generating enzyme required for sulfatase activity